MRSALTVLAAATVAAAGAPAALGAALPGAEAAPYVTAARRFVAAPVSTRGPADAARARRILARWGAGRSAAVARVCRDASGVAVVLRPRPRAPRGPLALLMPAAGRASVVRAMAGRGMIWGDLTGFSLALAGAAGGCRP